MNGNVSGIRLVTRVSSELNQLLSGLRMAKVFYSPYSRQAAFRADFDLFLFLQDNLN